MKPDIPTTPPLSPSFSADEKPLIPEPNYALVVTKDEKMVYETIRSAGWELTHQTQKLTEFESSGEERLYVVRLKSRLDRIVLMVHPRLEREDLVRLEGAASVSERHLFHSNMRFFPKRLNKGEQETAYGWEVTLETLGAVPSFLSALSALVRDR